MLIDEGSPNMPSKKVYIKQKFIVNEFILSEFDCIVERQIKIRL